MLFLLGTYVSTLMYKCLTIFVELDKTIKVVDEDAFTLEVLNKLMEFIKSIALRALYLAIPVR